MEMQDLNLVSWKQVLPLPLDACGTLELGLPYSSSEDNHSHNHNSNSKAYCNDLSGLL